MANQNAIRLNATLIGDGSSTSATIELLKHPLFNSDATMQNFWGLLATAYTPTGVVVLPNDPLIASASINTVTQIVTLTLRAALTSGVPVDVAFWLTFPA